MSIGQIIAKFGWIVKARGGTKWRAIWEPKEPVLEAEQSQMIWLTTKSHNSHCYCNGWKIKFQLNSILSTVAALIYITVHICPFSFCCSYSISLTPPSRICLISFRKLCLVICCYAAVYGVVESCFSSFWLLFLLNLSDKYLAAFSTCLTMNGRFLLLKKEKNLSTLNLHG